MRLCAIPSRHLSGGALRRFRRDGAACFETANDLNGGGGFTTASASSVVTDPGPNQDYSLTSSATLTTGVLTAYAAGGDRVRFDLGHISPTTGLPVRRREDITATLSLAGTLSGLSSSLMAILEAGTPRQISPPGSADSDDLTRSTPERRCRLDLADVSGDRTASPKPCSPNPRQRTASEGVADFSGSANSLRSSLPPDVDVSTAGGFDNFSVGAPVPEPSTWALILMGFAGTGSGRTTQGEGRRRRNASSFALPFPARFVYRSAT